MVNLGDPISTFTLLCNRISSIVCICGCITCQSDSTRNHASNVVLNKFLGSTWSVKIGNIWVVHVVTDVYDDIAKVQRKTSDDFVMWIANNIKSTQWSHSCVCPMREAFANFFQRLFRFFFVHFYCFSFIFCQILLVFVTRSKQ